jgi:hypothetical protein
MNTAPRSTDTLDLYRHAEKIDIVKEILQETLSLYQWHYQEASGKQYRNVSKSSKRVIKKVVSLLRGEGQNSLAKEVEDALVDMPEYSTLTKNKVMSQVKKYMKAKMIVHKISKQDYYDLYREIAEKSFVEWCEKYPLEKAPEYYDNDWEPPIY